MTPPINSVDNETRAFIEAVQLVEDAGWVVLRPELAARRAANTPVGPELWGKYPDTGVWHQIADGTNTDEQVADFERCYAEAGWTELRRSNPFASPALPVVGAALTAYELQVLLGTSISGCNMEADRTFDLPAAWVRLKALGLIDRADGLAIATDKGLARIQACLTSPAAEPDYWAVWSATGTHIGTLPDKADAEKALQDYEWPTPKLKGSIKALYTHPAPSASREVTGFDSLNDDITNILDEHDLSQVLQDSMHEDIAQLIWSVINRCGNYVADHDTYPKEVHFSNGRVVKLSANGAYLTVGQALTLPEREG